jgi:hypothetical protein
MLTNLCNERPTWLKLAHEAIDREGLATDAAVDLDGGWLEDWASVWVDSWAAQKLAANHPTVAERERVDQVLLGESASA